MAAIVVGPLLRYVSETEATVWVETSESCEVEVLGHRETTFGVGGHHYALVRIEDLEPGGFYVSLSMIWDDHDMSDDWNISRAWHEEMARKEWWHERAVGGIMTYWIYQHIGNLSPRDLDEDNEIYRRVRGNPDATDALCEWAKSIESSASGTRWSFCRDLGGVRAIFMDSRAARVLTAERRSMFDDEVWEWIVDHCNGDFDHLLVSTTVPFLLSPGFHYLEAWNERLCDGAWGGQVAGLSENLRQAVDFDHWAAFQFSFARFRDLLEEVGSGRRGRPPASIAILSGDVHHAYLCDVAFRRDSGVKSPVVQVVCSPYRNPLDENERRAVRTGFTRPFTAFARALANLAGAPDPGIRWRLLEGPHFDNQVATLRLDGRSSIVRLDKTVAGEEHERSLEKTFERRIA